MQHTFLFEEGTWAGEGHMSDREGRRVSVTGRVEIRHRNTTWWNHTEMILGADPPVTFRSDYEVTPFAPGGDSTACTCRNSALGELTGTVALVGDSLMSVFRAADDQHWSMECLVQISPAHYLSRGVYFAEGCMVSAWAVELHRVQ